MLNSNTESKIMHSVSRLPPSPVYSCFMAIFFRLQQKTYDHAVERFTMRKDPLLNFFRISNVMLCCRKIFRFPRRPHCHIVNQACCQLNVMHKNNDLIIFIVILKAG